LAGRFGAAPAFDEPIREFLARAIDFRFELRRGLPHGYNHLDLDIWGNVLVRDGKVSAIIDFDDLAFSPCVVCLGYTLLGVFAADGEKAVLEYIGEYTKIRALIDEERDALLPVMLFRNYAIGAYELLRYGRIEDFEGVLRLERDIPGLSLAGGA
jgi:Ser/Thr protein kinase RdoA (MazF antagonist)